MAWLIVVVVFVLPFIVAATVIKVKPRNVYVLKEPDGLYIISYKWLGFSEYGETYVTAHHFYVSIESGETKYFKETTETKEIKPVLRDSLKGAQAVKSSIVKEVKSVDTGRLVINYKQYIVTAFPPRWFECKTRIICTDKLNAQLKWNYKI